MAEKKTDEESTALILKEATISCTLDIDISSLEMSSITPRLPEGHFTAVKRQLFTAKKEVNIVSVGKSGAGKSVLQNNILGTKREVILSSRHITKDLATNSMEKHGVTISITDTIGLHGTKRDCRKKLKETSKYMKGQGNVDLLVYCISVSPSSKFEEAETAIMESLQDAFGKDIWKKCIVVFTFSNQVLATIREDIADNDEATAMFKDHIKDYATRFEEKLTQLKVSNIHVKTVFDLPLEAPQPDHTTIMAIPAGNKPTDEVLLDYQYGKLQIEIKGQVLLQEVSISNWCDVIFCEIITKCDDDLKKTLLQYRYGLSKVEIGAIVGGTIGVIGFVPGMAIGAAVGAGIGALVEVVEDKKIRLAQQT